MTACATAHHWLRGLGIQVQLMPAQYVRAYVRRNKTRRRRRRGVARGGVLRRDPPRPRQERRTAGLADLSNHFVSAQQDRRRDCQALGGRRFKVDHELEFCRKLDRQISRLCTQADAHDVDSGLSLQVDKTGSEREQHTCSGVVAHRHRDRQTMARSGYGHVLVA